MGHILKTKQKPFSHTPKTIYKRNNSWHKNRDIERMKTYKLKVYQDNILIYTVEATIDYIQVAIKNLSAGQHYELVLIN